MIEQENRYLRSTLDNLRNQATSSEEECRTLSAMLSAKDNRVKQVVEEGKLLSETLKTSLQSATRDLQRQTQRLKEEREVLTSSLRTALDRVALENTALRSQLNACGVSVDSVLRSIMEKIQDEEDRKARDFEAKVAAVAAAESQQQSSTYISS